MASAAREGCNPERAASPPANAATDAAAVRRRNLALSTCASLFATHTGSLRLR